MELMLEDTGVDIIPISIKKGQSSRIDFHSQGKLRDILKLI